MFVHKPQILILCASLGIYDELPLVQKEISHLDRLTQEPSGVVPEVEDEAAHPFLHQLVKRPLQVPVGPFLERDHANVTDAFSEIRSANAMHFDDVADNGHLEGLLSVTEDGHRHLGSLGPPQLSNRLDKCHVLGWLTVDLDDAIPSLDPGPIRGGPFDGGDHREMPVPHRDLDP